MSCAVKRPSLFHFLVHVGPAPVHDVLPLVEHVVGDDVMVRAGPDERLAAPVGDRFVQQLRQALDVDLRPAREVVSEEVLRCSCQ